MIAIKAIIITTISINFIVNSTKFGSKTKLNQNYTEQIPEEIKICQENRYHVQPRALRNGNGRFVFEVNGTEEIQNFVQLVEVVMCREVETACGVGEMRSRRRTVCRQDFRRQRMMALDGEGQLRSNMFNVPSGCICQLLEY